MLIAMYASTGSVTLMGLVNARFDLHNKFVIRHYNKYQEDEVMSANNKRVHIRNKLRAEIKLSHPQVGDLTLHTGDISESGAYILAEGNELPAVGEVVAVQVQGLGDGGSGPLVQMRVVRIDNEGIGLRFVNDDDNPET